MMPRKPDDAPPPPAALVAFLRGVERRGAAFAQLQVGDAGIGDRALVAAMRAFRLLAARLPIADWPRQFWVLLLATPELREAPATPRWGSGFGFFANLGRGPRAALLLRLVAGLGEAEAAAVLGVARPTYRLALQRALPHLEDGRPDAEAWRMLGESARHAVRDLPVERISQLARMREAAVHGHRFDASRLATEPASATGSRDADTRRARWVVPAMVAVAAATVLALAASFFLPGEAGNPGLDAGRIEVAPLPPAAPPRSTFDPETALLTHPDFDLLVDEASGDAVPRDPGFYAWLAAGAEPARGESSPQDAAAARGANPDVPQDPPETDDAL